MRNLREIENIRSSDLFFIKKSVSNYFDKNYPKNNFRFLGSGKAAISSILSYLRNTNTLPDKTYEVYVPKWMGNWVYSQINQHAFTSPVLTDKTKVLFVYHQYGFPQKMNKIKEFSNHHNLVVIEDCAHSLITKNDENGMGFFGDFSIHSFSKFFYCNTLGGVISKNPAFLKYLDNLIVDTPSWIGYFNNSSKIIVEYLLKSFKNKKRLVTHINSITYPLYNFGFKASSKSIKLAKLKIWKESEARKKYYKYFLEESNKFGICDPLPHQDLAPYIIPAIVKEKHANNLATLLKKEGFNSGVYHFDINRSVINPDFKKCVWIFCHGGINDSQFEKQLDCMKKVL